MNRKLTGIALLILLVSLFVACEKPQQTENSEKYGGEVTMLSSTSLDEIYANPELFDGKELKLVGTIGEVCQKKGCWLKLKDGDRDITVRFKDYAFFVPKDGAGNQVIVQGIFQAKTDKHVEEEAQAQREAGEEVNEEPSYSFTASAVVITPLEPAQQ
jgi:hypothetical protein